MTKLMYSGFSFTSIIRQEKNVEKNFLKYMGAVKCPIIILNTNMDIVFTNALANNLLGLNSAELIAKPLDIILNGFNPSLEDHLVTLSNTSGFITKIQLKSSNIIANQKEYKVCTLSVLSDFISEQLKSSQRRKELIESIPTPSLLINSKGVIIQCNAMFNNYIGFDDYEILGKKYDFFIPRRLHSLCFRAMKELVDDTYKNKKQLFQFETTTINSIKKESPVLINIKSFNLNNEMIFLFSLVDVSKEEKLRKDKEKADLDNASKSTFLANMSHEIRTPLAAITGFSELIAIQPSLPLEKRNFYLSLIQQSGKHLGVIIDDILDLSKISSGNMVLEKIEVDLRLLIQNILDSLALIIKGKQNVLSLNIESNVPEIILSDPTRIKQVIYNLIGNANKFTKKGKLDVNLSYNENDKLVIFNITDTGCGIKKKSIEKVFVPFSQEDNSTTRYHGGTGLGLSLSKKLSNLLGGDVRIVASKVRKGSQFEFTFSS
jgi:PAS domain S-box-containing protein